MSFVNTEGGKKITIRQRMEQIQMPVMVKTLLVSSGYKFLV